MTGLTDVFVNELVKNQANTDGFVRSPMGFTYKLYNGSFVKTLNSNIDGKRAREQMLFALMKVLGCQKKYLMLLVLYCGK